MNIEERIDSVRRSVPGVVEFSVDPDRHRDEWLALRAVDATASQSPCLVTHHDYCTPREMFEAKKGRRPDPDETPAMLRGRLLEPIAVQVIQRERPHWQVYQPRKYFRMDAHRMGATPDAFAIDPEREGFGIIQIKCPNAFVYRDKWLKGNQYPEPPTWTAIQALQEAALTGASWAAVAPLTTDNGLLCPLIEVPIIHGVMDALKTAVADFWRRYHEDDPPAWDLERDADLIEDAHNPTTTVDATGNKRILELLSEKSLLSSNKTAIDKRLKAIKAEILDMFPDVARAQLADGRILTLTRAFRSGHNVPAYDFIDVKVIQPKKGGK